MTAQPRPRWKRYALWSIAIALVVSAASLWRAYRLSLRQLSESRCDGHETFIQSEWMDTTKALGKLAIRGCMIDDLLTQHELRGMSRSAVVALIGEPAPTDQFTDYDMVYWLGPERGLIGTDSEWLVIRLDGRKVVASAELVTG